MKDVVSNLKFSALISSFLIVPFIILELVNSPASPEDFPIVLFVFLWTLSVIFISILTAIIRGLWLGTSIVKWGSVLLRVALLIPIGWIWIAVILDQMPCFFGVPNCD